MCCRPRLMEKLSGFAFTVHYVPGEDNVLPDALSCLYEYDAPAVRASSKYVEHDPLRIDDLMALTCCLLLLSRPPSWLARRRSNPATRKPAGDLVPPLPGTRLGGNLVAYNSGERDGVLCILQQSNKDADNRLREANSRSREPQHQLITKLALHTSSLTIPSMHALSLSASGHFVLAPHSEGYLDAHLLSTTLDPRLSGSLCGGGSSRPLVLSSHLVHSVFVLSHWSTEFFSSNHMLLLPSLVPFVLELLNVINVGAHVIPFAVRRKVS